MAVSSVSLQKRQRDKLKKMSLELGINQSAVMRMLIDRAEVGTPVFFNEGKNNNSQSAQILADAGATGVLA